MNVLWLANIPSPYRVNFFNELGKYCKLTVLFERKASTERNESWKNFNAENFSAVFLRGIKLGVAEGFCPSVISKISRYYDHIVVTNFSDPTGMMAIAYMRFRKIPYEIESDGAFPGTGKGIKEKLKKWLLKKAIRYFSTAKIHDEYYMLYGAAKDRIVRYPFTSVFDKDIAISSLSAEEKLIIKNVYHITEETVVLAVGQFIHRKGFDVLIRASKKLHKSVGVYIVGGEPPKEYLDLINELKVEHVHFIDFVTPDILSYYYKVADVFVHPTREDIWGLVINEALAYGVPVVTTNKCIAGTEMIDNGKNGFVVAAEDEEALIKAILSCCQFEMFDNCVSIAKTYTFEKMVLSHINSWK